MNLVFLPATGPSDATYGIIPERISGYEHCRIHTINYPRLVWYNKAVQAEAIAQIRSFNVSPIVLVGFSKSGLGAWNIAKTIPGLAAATIIFDSPMTRATLPPWGTAPFYADDSSWQKDLPLNSIDAFKSSVPGSHRLILISGAGFHDEMFQMSQKLSEADVEHTFLPRPGMRHHWNSGWIEEGLAEIER